MDYGKLALGAIFAALWGGCSEPSREAENMTAALTLGTSPGSDASSGATSGEPGGSSADPTSEDGSSTGGLKLDVGIAPTSGATVDPDSEGPNTCEQDIDIVFVMDVSTSMGPLLDTLAAEIDVVDQALAALELPGEPHYGLVVFVDDIALLGAGAPYPDAAALKADFEMWSDFTASNSQVSGAGSNSTWPENSLDALHAAAQGFAWRPAASTLRIVIHTTDDTFWNGPATGNGVMIEHSFADTVQALQDQQVRVFSFTAEIGGSCNCEDVTAGWSAPFGGMTALPEATDGQRFDIDMVLGGQISLSAAINESVEGAVCDPYEPVG